MAINYAIKKIKNPNGIEGTSYYHAQAKVLQHHHLTLGERLDDVVFHRLEHRITVTLGDGSRVVDTLGKLLHGEFTSLDGKCYTQEDLGKEDFNPASKIKSHRIVFRPDVELKKAVAMDFSLKRISSEVME